LKTEHAYRKRILRILVHIQNNVDQAFPLGALARRPNTQWSPALIARPQDLCNTGKVLRTAVVSGGRPISLM
jgi:hypothetical protein